MQDIPSRVGVLRLTAVWPQAMGCLLRNRLGDVRKQRVGGSQQVSAKPNDVPRAPAAAVLKPNATREGTLAEVAQRPVAGAAVEKKLIVLAPDQNAGDKRNLPLS